MHLSKRTDPEKSTPQPPATDERSARIEELRQRYKTGTLFRPIDPDHSGLDRLMDDVFPEAKKRARRTKADE